MPYPANTIEKIWSLVRIGSPDECWPWLGGFWWNGYARIRWKGKGRRAHVVIWSEENGRDPLPGMLIRHSCDNPPCCNPAHLLEGTQADNMADMVARGRSTGGERNPSAKLTADDVRTIRILIELGMDNLEIAGIFGVTRPTITRIETGKAWR